jgi:hypothetical protein
MSIERDGIKECNEIENAVEPLINVDELKKRWLFGIVPIKDETGNDLPDESLQAFIDTAISMLEHDLDISIIPRRVVEPKDYSETDYFEWGYFHLNNIPVIKINSLKVVYLIDEDGTEETVLDIPKSWFRLTDHAGELRLIPNNKFPANLAIDSAGAFFPELFRRHGMVPHLWRIDYEYGFKNGKVPKLVNAAIGMLASIMAMNIAGDLKIGSGIASTSLNLDGLSQTINSTASAENHTYSAKVKAYGDTLFGQPGGRNNGVIKMLRDYYKGSSFNII